MSLHDRLMCLTRLLLVGAPLSLVSPAHSQMVDLPELPAAPPPTEPPVAEESAPAPGAPLPHAQPSGESTTVPPKTALAPLPVIEGISAVDVPLIGQMKAQSQLLKDYADAAAQLDRLCQGPYALEAICGRYRTRIVPTPKVAETSPKSDAAPAHPMPIIIGLISLPNGELEASLLFPDNGVRVAARAGDRLHDGTRVERVTQNGAVVSRGDGVRILPFSRP